MKNKHLFISTLALASVLGTAAVSASGISQARLYAADDSTWGHYTKRSASFTDYGCKEYWVNCGTHETVFVAPETGTILEKGQATTAFANGLDSSDPRRLAKLDRNYDFEDGVIPSDFTPKSASVITLSIDDSDSNEHGTKSLKIVVNVKDDWGVKVSRDYLDTAFADSTVTSIDFDAKGSVLNNNFRYRQYTTAAGKVTNTCYEVDSAPYKSGLVDTGYKTFHYTRAMYNDLVSSTEAQQKDSYLIYSGATAVGEVIHIDNIRYSRKAWEPTKGFGCNEGEIIHSGNDWLYCSNNSSANLLLKVNSEKVTDMCLASNPYAEGGTALKVTKSEGGYACFMVNAALYNALSDTDYLAFDMYIENLPDSTFYAAGTSEANKGACWTNSSGGSGRILGFNLDGGRAYTMVCQKSDMQSNGRLMYMTGSGTKGIIYFDNFRILSSNSIYDMNMETGKIEAKAANGATQEVLTYRRLHNATSVASWFASVQTIANNGILVSHELSTDFASEGSRSLKITKNSGYAAFFFNQGPNAYNAGYKKVDFDIMVSVYHADGKITDGTNASLGALNAYTWKHVQVDCTSNNRYLIVQGGACDVYIDNVVFTK